MNENQNFLEILLLSFVFSFYSTHNLLIDLRTHPDPINPQNRQFEEKTVM